MRRAVAPGAGEELAVFRLPVGLRCTEAHPAERSLYAGGADGRIFEVSAAAVPAPRPPYPLPPHPSRGP